jgi:hypothetical protein
VLAFSPAFAGSGVMLSGRASVAVMATSCIAGAHRKAPLHIGKVTRE